MSDALPRPSRSATSVVTSRRPDVRVWREAMRLADGDARRLEVLSDGSVHVANHHVR